MPYKDLRRPGARGLIVPPPPNEGMLRIFIAFKIPFPSAGFEPANFGSNDKHASHYTTDDE
jgi:hypothetical protein